MKALNEKVSLTFNILHNKKQTDIKAAVNILSQTAAYMSSNVTFPWQHL